MSFEFLLEVPSVKNATGGRFFWFRFFFAKKRNRNNILRKSVVFKYHQNYKKNAENLTAYLNPLTVSY